MARRLALALLLISSSGWAQTDDPTDREILEMRPNEGDVTIDFRGGNVGMAMAESLNVLSKAELLPTKPVSVEAGDNVCKILTRRGFPPACDALHPTIARLNPNRGKSLDQLSINDVLLFPAVRIVSRTAARELDVREASGIKVHSLFFRWKGLKLRQVAGRKQIAFQTYQMFIPTTSAEQAKQMYALLPRSENVIPNRIPRGQQAAPAHASVPDLRAGDPCLSSLFQYQDLLDSDSELADLVKRNPETKRPVALLVDVPLQGTPDLDDPPPSQPPSTCRVVAFDRGRHHSTLLAGIVASRNGMRFAGLAPKTKFKSVTWAKADPTTATGISYEPTANYNLVRKLDDILSGAAPGLTILLAATSFPATEEQIADIANNNNDPRSQYEPNTPIAKNAVLVVASVGQAEAGDSASLARISRTYGYSPQNLGDWDNVVLVTACAECKPNSVSLLPSAFRPLPGTTSTITLVAPGGQNIPGWVAEDSMSAAPGTSQAAAFVAGVAASMYSRFPDTYTHPNKVKYWLSATAWPLLPGMGSDQAAATVEMGLIDPQRALLDPTSAYLKPIAGSWRPIALRKWVQDKLQVRSISGQQQLIPTNEIARIINVSTTATARYAIFRRPFVGSGRLERLGPVSIVDQVQLQPCAGGAAISVTSLEELILPMGRLSQEGACD